MKRTNAKLCLPSPTLQLTLAYEAAYRYFCKALFQDILGETLPEPVLTFSRSRKKQAVSFFARETWRPEDAPERRLSEIALVPERTGCDPRELMSHLVREMAHFADHLAGTAPKSAGYHGRRWFERMAKLGLPAEPVSPKSRIAVVHTIDPEGPFARAYAAMPRDVLLPFTGAAPNAVEETSAPQGSDENTALESSGKRTSMHGRRLRYECPRCRTIMRGPAGRKLICGDCELPYLAEASPPMRRGHSTTEEPTKAFV